MHFCCSLPSYSPTALVQYPRFLHSLGLVMLFFPFLLSFKISCRLFFENILWLYIETRQLTCGVVLLVVTYCFALILWRCTSGFDLWPYLFLFHLRSQRSCPCPFLFLKQVKFSSFCQTCVSHVLCFPSPRAHIWSVSCSRLVLLISLLVPSLVWLII